MPVPVLFTIPNFITAGSGRAMMNIIERLDRDRFAPAVCVLRKGGSLDAEAERVATRFLEAPFTLEARPLASLAYRAWKAAQPFRRYRFALWHSFHYLDDYTEPLIARMAGARAWIYTKKNMGWRRSWYVRSLLARRVAAQNTDIMTRFLDRPALRGRGRLIPPSVDASQYSPEVPSRLQMRRKLAIGEDQVVVACVAQLVPVKGHPTLIRAAARHPGLHLWLAGSPLDQEYTRSLEALIRELNLQKRVHLLGGVADVPALLAEADVFALPTWAKWRIEGCPIALLEAMACAKACVATDVPGSRDVIVNGANGLLAQPGDVDSLAQALGLLASSQELRRSLGAAARRRVLENYTLDREVRQYEDLYSEIIS